ncbi:MAG: patatin-like phospholipase family protein, partial [Bacteroidota bacterium]|nr:patatin-like phospholipase family protein [Bacteroidota bacterium]
EIETLTGKTIQENFDLFAGSSTGGLIACLLSVRDEIRPDQPKYSLREVADMYAKKGEIIFPIRTGFSRLLHRIQSLFMPAYSASGLDRVLRQYIADQTITDVIRPLLIASYDVNQNQPVFFKTSEAAGNPSANARLYDVCRATSAAPTFLPAHSFFYKNQRMTGIDGGVFVNNPSMAALAEISKYGNSGFYKTREDKPVQLSDVRILSLGTGSYEGTISNEEAAGWGQLQWITRITDIMMKGVNKTTHYETGEMMTPGHYLRLNITIADKKYTSMDDASPETHAYLLAETERQVFQDPFIMQQLSDFLGKIS